MKTIAVILLLFISVGCHNSSQSKLYVLIWNDYLKSELIKAFEHKYQCEVIIDTYDSNESMYAKLKYGSGGYDIIVPSGYYMEILNLQDMLLPLTKSSIPNIKNVDPDYTQEIDPILLDYGVPYMVSVNGVAYRHDKIPKIENSWDIFADSKFKGRMTMLNDIRETLGAALMFLGYSANTLNEKELNEAVDVLIKWKHNLAKFEGEQYKSGISSGEFLVVAGYNGDILQVMQENHKISFFYPKEGVIIAVDYLSIPKDAPNPLLAHEFINYLLDADVAAQNMISTLFLSPNVPAYAKLPEELRNNDLLFLNKDVRDRAQTIHYLGKKGQIYNKAWDKVRAN